MNTTAQAIQRYYTTAQIMSKQYVAVHIGPMDDVISQHIDTLLLEDDCDIGHTNELAARLSNSENWVVGIVVDGKVEFIVDFIEDDETVDDETHNS